MNDSAVLLSKYRIEISHRTIGNNKFTKLGIDNFWPILDSKPKLYCIKVKFWVKKLIIFTIWYLHYSEHLATDSKW